MLCSGFATLLPTLGPCGGASLGQTRYNVGRLARYSLTSFGRLSNIAAATHFHHVKLSYFVANFHNSFADFFAQRSSLGEKATASLHSRHFMVQLQLPACPLHMFLKCIQLNHMPNTIHTLAPSTVANMPHEVKIGNTVGLHINFL